MLYTIRVYNEGDLDGYAESIADYLPEGLGYLVHHKINDTNRWEVTGEDSSYRTVKLNTIPNASSTVVKIIIFF